MIKLSLDVSTKSTGWAIFNEQQYIASGVIKLIDRDDRPFTKKIKPNIATILSEVKKIPLPQSAKEITLIIETSIILNSFTKNYASQNKQIHQSAKVSTKLSMYSGIFLTLFMIWLKSNGIDAELKMVDPTSWHNKLFKAHESREWYKEQAIEFAKKYKKSVVSDDEADAVCIAFIGHEIEDFYELAHIKKQIKVRGVSIANKIKRHEGIVYKYETEIKARVKQGLKPLKQQTDMLERNKEAILNLKEERESLNGTKFKNPSAKYPN